MIRQSMLSIFLSFIVLTSFTATTTILPIQAQQQEPAAQQTE